MNLSQLHHLIALAESGSFSKSAAALHLTQPALSRSIRALEDELGLPLVDRIGRRNELTPFGHTVLERAKRIVFEATELRQSAQHLKRGRGGRIRVGLGSGPGAMLMTPLLELMAREHPRVKLTITGGPTGLQVQALRERTLDALVVDARSVMPAEDLRIEALPELRAGFLCRKGHPLATKRRAALGFDALLHYPIASSPLSDEVARLLVERYGVKAHPAHCVTLRCETLASLVDVALRSDAVYVGIVAAARDALAAGDMVELAIMPTLDAGARFALVTLEGRTEPPSMRIVRALVAERLRD